MRSGIFERKILVLKNWVLTSNCERRNVVFFFSRCDRRIFVDRWCAGDVLQIARWSFSRSVDCFGELRNASRPVNSIDSGTPRLRAWRNSASRSRSGLCGARRGQALVGQLVRQEHAGARPPHSLSGGQARGRGAVCGVVTGRLSHTWAVNWLAGGGWTMAAVENPTNLGHSFVKKTFHRPTYCHNCTDMLWGLMQQGSICEGKHYALLHYNYPSVL